MNQDRSRFRWLKLALKIVVSGVCIWYISGKVDVEQAGKLLLQADWFYGLPALVLFVLSKLVSAIRLQVYFSNIQLPITARENTRLYWLGMFYNLFLPGAISGDIYKVVLLSKRFNQPFKKITGAVILDRFSGLLGLGILLAFLACIVSLPAAVPILISLATLLSITLFYFFLRRYFPDFKKGFYHTLLLGIAVQALQIACVYMIMKSLGITINEPAYLFIFLVSSAASVLPVTIGGLGIRELVFLEGSVWFQNSTEKAVLISLIFYLLTLFTSVWGAVWLFKSPINEKGPSDEPLIS
ncbi:MAG TPA: lysylphosphatidylglycerol synthase transmembrane domain-containing protein [Chitinophagaceae bacterium]|nr:lysylphosphatidylglycerol synthase transmembrane domain-containing protein [Chitinophagaceae bacterium]HPN60226.1 lysylphosphatidylglycerol synthase transmembrane domain-containing protein [Chitinophagaceae bacterium]